MCDQTLDGIDFASQGMVKTSKMPPFIWIQPITRSSQLRSLVTVKHHPQTQCWHMNLVTRCSLHS